MRWIEVTHILEMIRRDTGPFDPKQLPPSRLLWA